MTGDVLLGIDVGGTKARAALVGEDLSVLAIDQTPTAAAGESGRGGFADPPGLADPRLAASLALAERMADHAASQGWAIRGVGVGVPEYVKNGRLHSRLVMAWDAQPVDLFAAIAPVSVESDVRCGAIAESAIGAGRDADSMLYVSVGTGISSAFALDGRIWEGHRGEAIALGELPVDPEVDAGTIRTLEEFASGSAIARRYERATGQSVDGARQVIALAEGRDVRARAIVESAATALGSALAWAVDVLDPQVVVLGGGLGTSGGWWIERAVERYRALSRPHPPAVVAASLGSDSGVIGAALIARPRH